MLRGSIFVPAAGALAPSPGLLPTFLLRVSHDEAEAPCCQDISDLVQPQPANIPRPVPVPVPVPRLLGTQALAYEPLPDAYSYGPPRPPELETGALMPTGGQAEAMAYPLYHFPHAMACHGHGHGGFHGSGSEPPVQYRAPARALGYPGQAWNEGDYGDRGDYGDHVMPTRQLPTPVKRGKFKSEKLKAETAATRITGNCIRCRMQRVRCDRDPSNPTGPCVQCKKMLTQSTVWRAPCQRWKIVDVQLYKPGQVQGLEWTLRWKKREVDDIGTWASPEVREIGVTEGYTGDSVRLRVRRFVPQEGDRLTRSWVSGNVKKSVYIPPFAIVDLAEAKKELESYILKGFKGCCARLLGSRLLWETYERAVKLLNDAYTDTDHRELLTWTRDLWMSVRLTTRSFEIVGKDTLGIDVIDDQASPLCGKLPIPPVLGAQLDGILIDQLQSPLRKNVLQRLQTMTLDRKLQNWLSQYLVTFILLHNLSLVTRHDAEYARKHGMSTRFARMDKVREYNVGANTLLAYFHYCNKGVHPFSDECKESDLASLASMGPDSINFVKEVRIMVKDNLPQWKLLWNSHDYENEYFYLSQLFDQDWRPRLMA